MSSDVSVSTALMTSSQLNDFANNISDPVSNSVTYQNGTSVQNSVTIPQGLYYLVFYAYLGRANIEFGYEISPNTPFSYGPIPTPLASGIASFGIYNNSGVVTPYEIRTNQIVGVTNISSFQVNTPDAPQYGDAITGATLQLNALLVVNDNGSSSQKVYWVQDVPDFVTGASQVSFGDEIWNFTDLTGYLSNQTITSTNFQNGGFVYPGGNGTTAVYNYNGNNATYALPLNFGILVSETVLPNTGVLVQLGYHTLANGSAVSSTTNWFDNVTIHDASVQTAYFDVNGNSTTPVGDYFDAELVFAGEGNLESANFTQLNATLGLFYQNTTTGILSSFPTYYDFSGDTGEAANDLVVNYTNGIVSVEQGANPNYVYLGNASLFLNPNSLTFSSLETNQTTTPTTSLATSTSSTTITSSVSSSSTSTTATTSSNTSIPTTVIGTTTSSSSTSNTGFLLITAGAAILVIVVVGGVVIALRHRRSAPPAMPPPV